MARNPRPQIYNPKQRKEAEAAILCQLKDFECQGAVTLLQVLQGKPIDLQPLSKWSDEKIKDWLEFHEINAKLVLARRALERYIGDQEDADLDKLMNELSIEPE